MYASSVTGSLCNQLNYSEICNALLLKCYADVLTSLPKSGIRTLHAPTTEERVSAVSRKITSGYQFIFRVKVTAVGGDSIGINVRRPFKY